MKTTINDLVITLTHIDMACTELHDIAVKPSTTDQETESCNDAIDLLRDFKNMLLRTKVEI